MKYPNKENNFGNHFLNDNGDYSQDYTNVQDYVEDDYDNYNYDDELYSNDLEDNNANYNETYNDIDNNDEYDDQDLDSTEENKKPKKFFKKMWLIFVLITSAYIAACFYPAIQDMFAIKRTDKIPASIAIAKGSSRSQIASVLNTADVVKNKTGFEIYLTLFKHSTKFTKGDYTIPKNLDYAGIVNFLTTQSNRTDVVSVTIPEGLNVEECGQLLESNDICKKDEFCKACKSNDFDSKYDFISKITNANQRYYKLEGYLYPDTYKFYLECEPSDVINKMLKNYKDKIIDLNNGIPELNGKESIESVAKEKGYTIEDVLTLASIVQAEAADTNDMKIIAGIFENRLNSAASDGYKQLGSDATKYYPYRTKEAAPENYESNYSTYKIKGLPPGPICNPSMDAIYAVLYPKKTNYMYFAHDKNGKAYYAANEQAHQANLKKIK